jgi:hypothetical protein
VPDAKCCDAKGRPTIPVQQTGYSSWWAPAPDCLAARARAHLARRPSAQQRPRFTSWRRPPLARPRRYSFGAQADDYNGTPTYVLKYKLPAKFTCNKCFLQWWVPRRCRALLLARLPAPIRTGCRLPPAAQLRPDRWPVQVLPDRQHLQPGPLQQAGPGVPQLQPQQRRLLRRPQGPIPRGGALPLARAPALAPVLVQAVASACGCGAAVLPCCPAAVGRPWPGAGVLTQAGHAPRRPQLDPSPLPPSLPPQHSRSSGTAQVRAAAGPTACGCSTCTALACMGSDEMPRRGGRSGTEARHLCLPRRHFHQQVMERRSSVIDLPARVRRLPRATKGRDNACCAIVCMHCR